MTHVIISCRRAQSADASLLTASVTPGCPTGLYDQDPVQDRNGTHGQHVDNVGFADAGTAAYPTRLRSRRMKPDAATNA
jgi:hypothetical protein